MTPERWESKGARKLPLILLRATMSLKIFWDPKKLFRIWTSRGHLLQCFCWHRRFATNGWFLFPLPPKKGPLQNRTTRTDAFFSHSHTTWLKRLPLLEDTRGWAETPPVCVLQASKNFMSTQGSSTGNLCTWPRFPNGSPEESREMYQKLNFFWGGNHPRYLVSSQNIIYILRTAFKCRTHRSSCSAAHHCKTSFIWKSGFSTLVSDSTPPRLWKTQRGFEVQTSNLSDTSTLSATLHLHANYFLPIFLPQAILVVLEGHQTPVSKRPILPTKPHLRPSKMLAPLLETHLPPSSWWWPFCS